MADSNHKINSEQLNRTFSDPDSQKFKLGSFYFKATDIVIKDPKYGTVGSTITLEGNIPTFTNVSAFKLPKPEEIEGATEQIFQWLVQHEVVRGVGKTVFQTKYTVRGLVTAVYTSCNGKYSINDPFFIHLASGVILTILVDDIIETLQIFELDGRMGNVIFELIKKAIETKSIEAKGVGEASFPALEPALSAYRDLETKQKGLITQFLTVETGTFSDYLNAAFIIQKEKEKIYSVPEETFLFLRSYDVGAYTMLETFASVMNQVIPEVVRNSVLTKRAVQVASYIGAELNDLVSIKKDIMDEEGTGVNYVLYYVNNQKLGLVDAWNKAIEKLNSHCEELMFLANTIVESFPEEEGIEEYYGTFVRLLDVGGYYTYKYLPARYRLEDYKDCVFED